jgi:hypothetical protein
VTVAVRYCFVKNANRVVKSPADAVRQAQRPLQIAVFAVHPAARLRDFDCALRVTTHH